MNDVKTRIQESIGRYLAESTEELKGERAFPGAQVHVRCAGDVVCSEAWGFKELVPNRKAMQRLTPIDIASVTKIVSTALLLMKAIDLGLARWNDPIERYFPLWGREQPTGGTLLHLANHTSGLDAYRQFYLEHPLHIEPQRIPPLGQHIRDQILTMPRRPAGAGYAYSDLGYILLGMILEQVFSQGLDASTREHVLDPLGLRRTKFVNRVKSEPPIESAASTQDCPLRGRVITGVVHDENAYLLGGVAGHAGLFSTADELATFGQHLLDLDRGRLGSEGIVRRSTLRQAWSESTKFAGGHHLAGWDTPSGVRSSVGRGFGRATTVGHLGFTGTSLWIEREREVVAVLLTNRVHPYRENPRMLDARIAFHEAILPPEAARN